MPTQEWDVEDREVPKALFAKIWTRMILVLPTEIERWIKLQSNEFGNSNEFLGSRN